MAGRPSNNRSSQTPVMPPSARQNEYFVPRDGIDREVITSDICRYLGNDALVRPGTYESPDGSVTQGYFITAYRNLTSAMIQDLKADSARWEQERRAASRSSGNGAGGSRDQPRGQDYNAWKTSLREQEYQAQAYGNAMDIDYAPQPTGAASNQGYQGQQYQGAPPANYPPASYAPPVHGGAAHYQTQAGYGYAPNPPPTQYSPQPQSGDRYTAIAPPPIPAGYGQDPGPFIQGSNYQTGAFPTAAGNRMPPAMPHVSAAPPRTYNGPTTGAPVYGTETDPYGYLPQAGNPVPQGYPTDALYGRGAQQRPAFASPPDPQYDEPKSSALQPAVSPTVTAPAQIPTPGAPPARREREPDPRERDRDYRDHKSRRSEPEDRHSDRSRHHRR